jgi:RNA polymerase sigma-70 factor (ECF subfamily)
MSKERDLLTRLRAGDHSAFEAIFRAHYPAVCSFAHGYLRARDEAEEVGQAVFVALWSRREELDIRGQLRSYLLTAARNQALNRSARARVEQRWYDGSMADPTEEAASTTPQPDRAIESAQTSERVRGAIESLPPGCRRVLQLRWDEQLSHYEIAEILGISVKGVENQLARAKRLLRRELSDLVE